MKTLGFIDPETIPSIYEYKVEWLDDDVHKLYIVKDLLVYQTRGIIEYDGSTVVVQCEIPLLALDWILATLARYKLPPNLGGFSGFKMGDEEQFSETDLIVVTRSLNNPYGLPIYTISNHLRENYNTGLQQEWDFFEETLEGGLLKFLTELNEQYKNGELG